jgi:membrane protease YdiL (CAAX protease family)
MKILLLCLHFLPAVDQMIGNAVGYWLGLIPRSFVHFGVPWIWERNAKEAFLVPFQVKDKKTTLKWSILGALAAAVVLTVFYFLLADQFDANQMREEINRLYPVTPAMYLAVGLVISFVNPLMEEFYWRGFLYRKYAGKGGGLWIGALFAVHHYVIFRTWFEPIPLWIALVGLAGVGVLFNWLYRKTQNIYACLSTHAMADLVIIVIGYYLLFIAD